MHEADCRNHRLAFIKVEGIGDANVFSDFRVGSGQFVIGAARGLAGQPIQQQIAEYVEIVQGNAAPAKTITNSNDVGWRKFLRFQKRVKSFSPFGGEQRKRPTGTAG